MVTTSTQYPTNPNNYYLFTLFHGFFEFNSIEEVKSWLEYQLVKDRRFDYSPHILYHFYGEEIPKRWDWTWSTIPNIEWMPSR